MPREACLGSYTVLAAIARGGTSGVFLAEHVTTGDRVALKILDSFYSRVDDVVERLMAERTVSSRVRHPGLLEVIAADRSATGVPYLVMELLDGENLGALADRGDLELGAIAAIGAQIANAVAALHTANVVHCDLKPDNIFLLYDADDSWAGWPALKVIDYGVARLVDAPPESPAIAGTPAYMPPEQWRGDATVKSDVYALGCLLYELVTGDLPFSGPLPALMLAHSEKLPERPSVQRPEITPELERLILRMLAKDPGMRPTMTEVELGLRRLASDRPHRFSLAG